MKPFVPDNLHPDVAAMLAGGSLHLFDAEWISRLPEDSQLTAAVKCARDFNVRFCETFGPEKTPMSQTRRGGRAV